MFLTIQLCTYAKLNCLNRTDYLYINEFGIKQPTKFGMP